MNFNGFDFDDNTKMLLSELDGGGRLPHALIIESPDPQKAAKLAEYLSMYAVCSGERKPCGACKNCLNAQKTGSSGHFLSAASAQEKGIHGRADARADKGRLHHAERGGRKGIYI